MLRNILGILAGVVAAFFTIWLVDIVGHQFYPLRSDLNLRDPQQVAALLQSMPAGAQAFVVAAWLLGALVGGVVAGRIVGARWAAWTLAALVAVAAIANILMIPHPEWMQISAVVAPLLGGILAGHAIPSLPRRAGDERGAADAPL